MELLLTIIRPVVESLLIPIKKQLGYVVSSTKYIRDMGHKMEQLDGKAKDISHKKDRNDTNNLVIPHRVKGWLDDVQVIKAKTESMQISRNECLNVSVRYKVGKQCSKILNDIDRLMNEESEIKWTDERKPLGKVSSLKSHTITPSPRSTQFESRNKIFYKALESLHPNNKTQKIAICGTGGVGKTTMMEQLHTTVVASKMFDWVLKTAIGEKSDPIAFQGVIAEYLLSATLTEQDKGARVARLQKAFEKRVEKGEKVLIILDDIWEMVDLEDIGLSSLPDGFKLLLTSRDAKVCNLMGVEASSILRIDILEKQEANKLFWEVVGLPDGVDHELHKIGEDIVERCGGLPMAIKTIGSSLRLEPKDAWKVAFTQLDLHDLHDLNKVMDKIFEISYRNLKKTDEKAIFILSGLFPDDFDISIEDLLRYVWGLRLFTNVKTLEYARLLVKTCIQKLIGSNLLIESNRQDCVKMHDLARDFVLRNSSKFKQASIVDHRKWPTQEKNGSYERVLLNCMDMSKFPIHFEHPNLLLLNLMNGNNSLTFPEDFYKGMKNLQVISFEKMNYPLLPMSLDCSTNLRTLCLHECSLMFDCSSIGDILNLEILSFVGCQIWKLPASIKNLKKLKLLDLTRCGDLCIDDNIFGNLDSLEELYMRVSDEKAINFINNKYDNLEECSKNLTAFEIEFFENNAQPKNMSFEKLTRFKISMGRLLTKDTENTFSFENTYSYEREAVPFRNTLMLVTNKGELLESGISELFEKTEVLHLKVDGINVLEHVPLSSLHPHQYASFNDLRFLKVWECKELNHLFTHRIATALPKLEHLEISSCFNMKFLVHFENSEAKLIKLTNLKFIALKQLPKMEGLCNTLNAIVLPELVELQVDDLPYFTSIYRQNNVGSSSTPGSISTIQPFLNEEVVTPKLEKLKIYRMKNLREIWPSRMNDSQRVDISMLKEIRVGRCDRLVNLFPRNPLPLLQHLEELSVRECGSIKVLFNFDLGCAYDMEKYKSKLKDIWVYRSKKLREVWRMTGVNNSNLSIPVFKALESLRIDECKSFRNVFTPTTANVDLHALRKIFIDAFTEEPELESSTNDASKEEEISKINDISKEKEEEISTEVDDNISNVTLSSYLNMPTCHHLEDIFIRGDHKVKYLLSPLMAKRLSNLKRVYIFSCDGIEEVVSNRDDEHEEMATSKSISTNSNNFPLLDSLTLFDLPSLRRIFDGGDRSSAITSNDVINTTFVNNQFQLCQYSRKIRIDTCESLSCVIPSHATSHMKNLEVLEILNCESMIEVFETKRVSSDVDEESCINPNVHVVPTQKIFSHRLCNLRSLTIYKCDLLSNVFTFSTLESLVKLQWLTIRDCQNIQVIVKEEDKEYATTSEIVVFPCLQRLILVDLPNLCGFFLGINEFEWPLLDNVTIIRCPNIMTRFTNGHSTSPKLKCINREYGIHSLDCGLNFQEAPSSSLDGSGSFRSFESLIEINLENLDDKKIAISSSEFQKLQKLENIHLEFCKSVEGIFEASEANNGLNESQSVVEFGKLREVDLSCLHSLKYIWKNNHSTMLEFPNLTRVSISRCSNLEHVFTSSMVGHLLHLQELSIISCEKMEVIVKEEKKESDAAMNEINFPCLKLLKLKNLPCLEGFFLGKGSLSFPLLDTLKIKKCGALTVFTKGHSTTPELKRVKTRCGMCFVTEDLNSFIKNKREEGFEI